MNKNRKPNRMKGYDYSKDNLYFVTSCVENRVCCFGEIINREMILNEYGKIAVQQWDWLGEQFPYVLLHEFIVMPNHIHGILEINRAVRDVGTGRDLSLNDGDLSLNDGDPPLNDGDMGIGTGRDLSLPGQIKIKSLSELIGAYKTTVSKQIHLLGYSEFKWQRSFHDHIIRDEKSYHYISNYIVNNPGKWGDDKFYKK